jgi:hypothetical protein
MRLPDQFVRARVKAREGGGLTGRVEPAESGVERQ